jgi:hypothetical protein
VEVEFRIEKRIAALLKRIAALLMLCGFVFAQPVTFEVRHQHMRGGATGVLRIGEESIAFEEKSKEGKHSREWKYAEIQQLSLSATELRILTYEDRKWQLGRDRDFVFDRLPEELATEARPIFERALGQRFIAELAEPGMQSKWRMPAKLRHGLRGSEGILLVGQDRIVYQSETAGESRTWRFEDIDNVATAGPFDLSITTLERSAWRHAGPTEFRFQLKEALMADRYNELWRMIYRARRSVGGPLPSTR